MHNPCGREAGDETLGSLEQWSALNAWNGTPAAEIESVLE